MKFMLLAALALVCAACAPKIYVLDRQTVLEEEAAGRWPQYEKELLDHGRGKGPAPYSSVPLNSRRARLYRVLNGPLAGQPQ